MSTQTASAGSGLQQGSDVMVNISLPQSTGKSIGVNMRFDAQGQQVDFNNAPVEGPSLKLGSIGGVPLPIFDTSRYARAVQENDLDTTARLLTEHREALKGVRSQGGGTPSEIVGNAVYAFLEEHYNVKATDHSGPVLDRASLLVKAPASQPGTFVVQAAPKWGQANEAPQQEEPTS